MTKPKFGWIFVSLFVLSFFSQTARADEYLPANLLLLDGRFTHHVLLVEKQTHKLHLYENSGTFPRLVKTFSALTGKFAGDKFVDGDHKTPEGIYIINEFLSKETLFQRYGDYAKIYGSGAFPMNYPNFIDEREKKGGGGIWLHSTDDDTRVAKGTDTRGCVVVQNQDLKELSQYLDLSNTPIIVEQEISFLAKSTWEKNRKEISDLVNKWADAWKAKDFDTYIGSYSETDFYDRAKGGYAAYKAYKKAVFSRSDKPEIKLDSISILANRDYAVVQLRQDYRSDIINDVGKKTLYLRKNPNYEWKIVGELWTKLAPEVPDFLPTNRFFGSRE